MSAELVIGPSTVRRQQRASCPTASVWVSANAGAGKTKVLTDRVIRLLLTGSPPSRLLCLTFTKAAAAEMTGRVFKTLGEWVRLDDANLAKALTDLTGERPTPSLKARARRLFAKAVETPGGLKIETIHAFCERILHLVPFEANVPARFQVLDEDQTAELLAEARLATLAEAALDEEGARDLSEALDLVGSYLSGEQLIELIDAAVLHPRAPPDAGALRVVVERLAAAMALSPGETAEAIRHEMAEGGIAPSEWPAVAAALAATGRRTDHELGEALLAGAAAEDRLVRLRHYLSVFFTDAGSPRVNVATRSAPAALREQLCAEQERLVALRERLFAAEAVERTAALFKLAAAVREKVVELKRQRGALDFADLITKTLELLDRGAAPWILYKLDRGIDHVLVDEAQDTSEEQWRILRRLTEEFTAGHGRPVRAPRTFFAVGDPKQSIYSFQGADPRLFEDSRRCWLSRHEAARLTFDHVRLDLSFRSARAILRAVDNTFRVEAHFRGLSFEDAVIGTTHESARPRAPGEVELWTPELPSPEASEPDAWSLPLDEPERSHPSVKVANRIAQAVKCWTTTPDERTGRVWHPGEVLILARKRGPAFFATIRALKAEGIPVAGADRLEVNEQIAVNDLVAAGQAALLPENDLALAAALKSPLVGLDDDDLIRVAADRAAGQSLAAALEAASAHDDRARLGWAALTGWRELARAHGPFGFYATLLGPEGGRRRLVERLGGEAADAIDTFLCRAQAEETGSEPPSLVRFLHRFATTDHVIKRDPEMAGDEVRVMTVHGAKGLEAPLVVVLDGCERVGPDPKLIDVGLPGALVPVWAPGKATDPALVAAARQEVQRRAREEHHRLLYVALTRARDKLVVAPFSSDKQPPEHAWCRMVRVGFEQAGDALVPCEAPYGPVERWSEEGAADGAARGPGPSRPLGVPEWLLQPVPPETEPAPPLRPSTALGAADRAPGARREVGLARAEARRRGTLVHELIERLGALDASARRDAAARFAALHAAALADADRERIVTDALAVVSHPALAGLFGPGSRAEAAIAGRIGPPGQERNVSGQIDRLLVGPQEILFADFKTGEPPSDGPAPDSYLAQLALYRALLGEIYPGRPVRAFLVWTAGPRIDEPSARELDRALASALGTGEAAR